MTQQEIMQKVLEAVNAVAEDPSHELIKLGQTLVTIGKTLRGLSREEAIKVINATAVLTGVVK